MEIDFKKWVEDNKKYHRNKPSTKYSEKHFGYYPSSSIGVKKIIQLIYFMDIDREEFKTDITFDYYINISFGKEYLKNVINVDGDEFYHQIPIIKSNMIDGSLYTIINVYQEVRNDYTIGYKLGKTIKELQEKYFPPLEPEKIYVYPKEVERRRQIRKQSCYLMIDDATGYVKIGRSINPEARERTLQSEKPTIRMLHYFKNNHERELHELYREKRIRGEWFDLKENEITKIINQYK